MKIYAIKDEKVGWLNVLTDSNNDVAKFNFGRGFYTQNPEFGRLEDYSLYELGIIHVDDGFVYHDFPLFICNGLTAYNSFISRLNMLQIDKLEVNNYGDTDISKENQ